MVLPSDLGSLLHYLCAAILLTGLLVVGVIKDKFRFVRSPLTSLWSSQKHQGGRGAGSTAGPRVSASCVVLEKKGALGRPYWVWIRPPRDLSVEVQYGIRRVRDIWSMNRITGLRRSIACFFCVGALSTLLTVALEQSLLVVESATFDDTYCVHRMAMLCLTWRVQAMAYSLAALSLCVFQAILFLEDHELTLFRRIAVALYLLQSVCSQWTTSLSLDASVNASYGIMGVAICAVAAFAIWRESRRRIREGLPRQHRRRIWYILALALASVAWGCTPFLSYELAPYALLLPLLLLVVVTGRILYSGFEVGREQGVDIAPAPRDGTLNATGDHPAMLEARVDIGQREFDVATKVQRAPEAAMPVPDLPVDLDAPPPLFTSAA